jgi:hypothetical protein
MTSAFSIETPLLQREGQPRAWLPGPLHSLLTNLWRLQFLDLVREQVRSRVLGLLVFMSLSFLTAQLLYQSVLDPQALGQRPAGFVPTCQVIPNATNITTAAMATVMSKPLPPCPDNVPQYEAKAAKDQWGLASILALSAAVFIPLFAQNDLHSGRYHGIFASLFSVTGAVVLLVVNIPHLKLDGSVKHWNLIKLFEVVLVSLTMICACCASAACVHSTALMLLGRRQSGADDVRRKRTRVAHTLVKRLLTIRRVAAEPLPAKAAANAAAAPNQKTKWRKVLDALWYVLWAGGGVPSRLLRMVRKDDEAKRRAPFEARDCFVFPTRFINAVTFSLIFTLFAGFVTVAVALPVAGLTMAVLEHHIADHVYRILVKLVPIGLVVCACVGWACIVGILISLSRSFRSDVMALRMGKTRFRREQVFVTDSSRLIGYLSSHTLITWVFVFICTALVITAIVCLIFVKGLLRYLLEGIKRWVLGTFLSVLLVAYLQRVAIRIIFLNPEFHERLRFEPVFTVVDYALLFVNVAQGLFSAAYRLSRAIWSILFSFARIDMPVLVSDNSIVDGSFAVWCASVLIEHVYNFPVLVMACEILAELPSSAAAGKPKREVMARTRWHLAYTLLNNPQLQHQRKTALAISKTHSSKVR